MLRAAKVKLDDTYTEEYNIKPKGRIEVPTPEQETEHIEIKGRHGTLTKKYAFKDISLSVTFTIHGESFKRIFRESKMFLLFAETMLLDDDPAVYYKIKSATIDDAENKMIKFGEFTVDFTLDPFQYEIDNDVEEINDGDKINNPGYEAAPVIEIEVDDGDGELKINDQSIKIKDINGKIIVDSEMMNAYRDEDGSIENLNDHMEGDFPVLENGENEIKFDGDIDMVKITKNLRWV